MKSKIRQIIYDLRTQPIIAWVTMAGTALTVFLIMTVVMLQQVGVTSFAPESHRDRMLYGMYIHIKGIGSNSSIDNSSGMSREMARKMYDGLEGVEAIAYQRFGPIRVDARGTTRDKISVDVRQADAGFWQVFDHKLINGRFYTPEEETRKVAVVSEQTARRLFGSDNPVGQHFELDHDDYEVIGVIADSSPLATVAYGQVMTPLKNTDYGEQYGDVSASMLIAEGTDFDDVRRQVKVRYEQLRAELKPDDYEPVYHEAPYDQATIAGGLSGSNMTPDSSTSDLIRNIIYVILLVVPAINLSTMLHSRLRRRVSEIGVRRAFGCTRSRVIGDIIGENLLVTIAGGLIGFAFAVVFALLYDGLYVGANDVSARPGLGMLLDWHIIAITFAACFILNILSAAIPAWQVSRLNPVEAINAK